MAEYVEKDIYIKDMVSTPVVRYPQGAYGVPLKFNFRDYELPEGVSARFALVKPSQFGVLAPCDEISREDGNNYVIVDVIEQMTLEKGQCEGQLQVSKDGVNLLSFPVNFEVIESPIEVVAGLPQTKNDLAELLDALNKSVAATSAANAATEQSKQATQAANSATSAANEATTQANASKEAADSAASKANNSATAADSAAEKANEAAKNADDKRTQFEGEQSQNNKDQQKNNADQLANNKAAQGIYLDVLTVGEYDPDTMQPTVEGASGIIYAVPIDGMEGKYTLWLWDIESEKFIGLISGPGLGWPLYFDIDENGVLYYVYEDGKTPVNIELEADGNIYLSFEGEQTKINLGRVRGSYWYTGAGEPQTVQGSLDKDMYLDTKDGGIYQKESNAWNLKYSLPLTGGAGANLIDNWYFIDPINQRGKTEYTSNGYAIDRWYTVMSGSKLELMESGVKFSHQGSVSSDNFIQRLDDFNVNYLVGKTITLSALVSEVNVIDGRCNIYIRVGNEFPNGAAILVKQCYFTEPGLYTVQAILSSENTKSIQVGAGFVECTNAGENSVTIQAMKLEVGDHQTLAKQNKETDEWELIDPPPNKALELEKCKRYMWCFTTKPNSTYPLVAQGIASTNENIRMPIPGVSLRANPTVRFSGKWQVTGDGKTYNVSKISGDTVTDNSVSMQVTESTQALTPGNAYGLRGANDLEASLIFDANL